jgi:hypothetical protein
MRHIREDPLLYPGYYYRDTGAAIALLVSPAGRGCIGITKGDAGDTVPDSAPTIREFALPPLPQGFVYTGIALLSRETILGTWEEQDGWNVGAAGFVLAGIDVVY